MYRLLTPSRVRGTCLQGRTKGSGLQGVQGLVALTAATGCTGGLLVVPGSQHQHAELMRAQARESGTEQEHRARA